MEDIFRLDCVTSEDIIAFTDIVNIEATSYGDVGVDKMFSIESNKDN